MKNLDVRLMTLHRQVVEQFGIKVDMYYYEGYGALFVPYGQIFHPNTIIFAFPDNAIRQGL